MVIFFNGMPGSSFLFIHDEYFPLPGHEITEQFSARNLLDFGSSTTFQLIVTLFDRIYYALAYLSGLSLKVSQMLLYWLKLFAIMLLPYLGFARLARKYIDSAREEIVLLSSLWYSFNTYTVIYWHGNAFSLTLLICYALAPLALYWWSHVFFGEAGTQRSPGNRLKDTLILAQLLFLMSFALYLFAAFVLFLVAFTAIRLMLARARIINFLGRLTWLVVACVPLFIVHIMVVYEMFSLSIGAQNASGNETFGSLQGGLLYMSLMWFAWTIYTYWTPRNIWTFAEYYHSPIAVAAPFMLYALIFWGALRQRRNIHIITFALLFLIFLLLAKGPQEPLGGLYLFMINHIPGFRVFRSPDSKFGFIVVLTIAVLLLLSGNAIKTRFFVIVVAMVAVIQSWPLIIGIAIQGENTKTSHDRVIHIPKEYSQLADHLNGPDHKIGYILTLPSVAFGRYEFGKNEEHAGQDLLPKMIKFPFIYADESSGMSKPAYDKLMHLLRSGDYGKLRQFGIRYYVLRRDLRDANNSQAIFENFLVSNYKLVFRNSLFTLFEDERALPLIEGPDSTFNVANPARLDIKLNLHQLPVELVLHQNYHPSWQLYADTSDAGSTITHGQLSNFFTDWFENISFLWKKPISVESHRMVYGYANAWDISKGEINSLAGVSLSTRESHSPGDTTVTLFYWPQALFSLLAAISSFCTIVYFLVICIIIVRKRGCGC